MALKLTPPNNQEEITFNKCPAPSRRNDDRRNLIWDTFTIWVNDEPVTVHYEMNHGNWLYIEWAGQWFKRKKDEEVQQVYSGARFVEAKAPPTKRGATPGNTRAAKNEAEKRVKVSLMLPRWIVDKLRGEGLTETVEEMARERYKEP